MVARIHARRKWVRTPSQNLDISKRSPRASGATAECSPANAGPAATSERNPKKVAWMPNATIGISASPSAPESSLIKVTTLKATHNAGMVGMNQIRLTAIMRGSSK